MCFCSNFSIAIFAVTSTLIQSCARFGLLFYVNSFYECSYRPPEHPYFFLTYVTYFYKPKCGSLLPKEKQNASSSSNTRAENFDVFGFNQNPFDEGGHEIPSEMYGKYFSNINKTKCEGSKEEMLKEFGRRAKFGTIAVSVERTHNYFLTGVILDSLWIITAFGLLMGICCNFREYPSVFFYFPWILVSTAVMFFDMTASVRFSMDIHKTNNFAKWIRFVGVVNLEDFEDFGQEYCVNNLETHVPSVIGLLVFSRAGVIWILNLFLLIHLLGYALFSYYSIYAPSDIYM